MRKLVIAGSLIILTVTACIDAPRDNRYDPENPDRAYLLAYVHELGLYPMEYTVVTLTQDSIPVRSDTSNFEGIVEFEEIIPGIYDVHAKAQHYADVNCPPESLWAGVVSESLRIELTVLNFEDDPQGEPSPYAFEVITGSWMVAEDEQQPTAHSVRQVYRTAVSTSYDTAITLCQTEAKSFLFTAHLKLDSQSATSGRAGVVIRHQNNHNYYAITISRDSIYCDLMRNGIKTNLHTRGYEFGNETWYEICLERPHDWYFVRITLDGEIIYSIYDNVFSNGRPGLIACIEDEPGQTVADFDDITLDLTYGLPE